jgi:NAD(P)-dependent dehydrogenase (short-subunit alcohol dehydrogenase family)
MADPRALFDLSGKVACVTGASSGLGRRAADVLLAAGAQVVGVARRGDALADWQVAAGQSAAYVAADLGGRDQIAQIAQDISEPFGAPDILVHAAGINTREAASDVTAEDGT